MKVTTAACVTLGLIILMWSSVGAQESGARDNGQSLLTNASVVKLVRAGFSDKSVIAILRTRPVSFDLAPEQLIELKKSGVSERVILAMLARDEARAMGADDLGDDSFFDGSGTLPRANDRGGSSGTGDTNIFGSSGGSRGRTRSRGSNGGVNDNDAETTGSASVRIVRPPTSEAGGSAAAPRLERTPTLTNNSVIELVEAGFSDGTIIRRIESSPADFDLSPSKLTELQRRRVNPAVIAAMRAAASETDAPSNSPAPH